MNKVQKALESYLEYKNALGRADYSLNESRRVINIFLEDTKIRRVKDITARRLQEWVNVKAFSSGWSPTFTEKTLVRIKEFCNYLAINGMIEVKEYNKIRKVSNPVNKYDIGIVLTKEQVKAMFERCDLETDSGIRDALMLFFFYTAALHVGEVMNLKVSDISEDRTSIKVKRDNGDVHEVPITNKGFRYVLDLWLDVRERLVKRSKEHDYLFTSLKDGLPISSDEALIVRFRHIARKTGCPRGTRPGTLRKSLGVHLLQDGVDIKVVEKLLGESTAQRVETFVLTAKDIGDAIGNTIGFLDEIERDKSAPGGV